MISKEKAVEIIYNTLGKHDNISISHWDFSKSDNIRCTLTIDGKQLRFRFSLYSCLVEQCKNGMLISNEISRNIRFLIYDKWYDNNEDY